MGLVEQALAEAITQREPRGAENRKAEPAASVGEIDPVLLAAAIGLFGNEAKAVSWYRKAADQGNATAQSNLGGMYASGQGVPKDYVLAYMWRNLAAAAASDADIREQAVKAREALATMMTPAQVAEAQRMSRQWQPK